MVGTYFTMCSPSAAEEEEILEMLERENLVVQGQLSDASNATLLCTTESGIQCVYKPQAGERPLWDFPDGTLSAREVVSFEIDRALGFAMVPATVWRDSAPLGPGMCQVWITESADKTCVDVCRPDAVPLDWKVVLKAENHDGEPVVLAHSSDEQLQRLAIFDAIINNGDRKGGHVLSDTSGKVWGIDHGVSLASEPKLRTVLWGWANEPISADLLDATEKLAVWLTERPPSIRSFLQRAEEDSLINRVSNLLSSRVFPMPSNAWPSIPWPVF